MQFSTVIAVAIGGACGALCRLSANALVGRTLGNEQLPIATFAVNMIGCFALGFITGLGSDALPAPIKVGLATGFLGALTTFSTYAVEIITRASEKLWVTPFLILSGNLIIGLALAFAGLAVGKSFNASP